jgi:copper chaperone
MKTLRFSSNINCNNCKRAVTPFLNGESRITHWEVDTTHPLKILTIEGEDMDAGAVKELLKKAGYTAEEIA